MLCPVCKEEMRQTINTSLYMCPVENRRIVFSDFAMTYLDSVIYLNADGSPHTQIYEIPPYKFGIWNFGNSTVIEKASLMNKRISFTLSNNAYQYRPLLTINYILDLPWDNREKVLEKVKGYLIFS